ncbi:MAG: thiamine-phosphate kinase [Ghiorsea sp.]
MTNEFDAISRLFRKRTPFIHPLTQLANGDDASVHQIPENMELTISMDTAVSGVHWPSDMSLEIAGNRAVGAALSDLAAMGAKATWVWVAVMAEDTNSLIKMSNGIVQACTDYHVELAGGDTVSSPTNIINVTVAGLVPKGSAMTRANASTDDEIWLMGDLGLSAAGLEQWFDGNHDGNFVSSFQHIKPLLASGEKIRELGIQCCLDISDGLLQDANHIAKASNTSLVFEIEKLQTLPSYQKLEQMDKDKALKLTISGGEDYALLFTAPPSLHQALLDLGAFHLGYCSEGNEIKLLHDGEEVEFNIKGYDHFG